jgi:alkylation response protein AidB-like acyl-CoA dehydrogenase
MTDTATRDVTSEVTAWLEENWDPDITVREWWERLGLSGWGTPTWPEDKYGKGLSRAEGILVSNAIAEFGALGPPGGLGLLLAGPTINDHGTPEQIKKYVEDIVTGRQAWCQLFSEPGAGSDLAGLTCKAVKDGEEYIITGQKVWTSGGQIADMGMLIARTNTEVPKHQGITWFSFDMHQDGVDVRPLREMTGHAMFNEVYLDEARVPESAIVGGLHNGWAVANTTLMHERSGLGAGGGSAAGGFASPGTIAKDLDKRVGDFVTGGGRRRGGGGGGGMFGSQSKLLIDLAKGNGKIKDPAIRQDLMRLHTMNELGRMQNLRIKGGDKVPGAPNIAKLSMSNIVRLSRDVGLAILGPEGMLHGYTPEQTTQNSEATGNPFSVMVTSTALYAQAPPIYGGTDQVQRNIIGERVLGLPKEANNDKTAAFKDLPKNA